MRNIVIASFNERLAAYRGMEALEDVDRDGAIELLGAAVVERTLRGQPIVSRCFTRPGRPPAGTLELVTDAIKGRVGLLAGLPTGTWTPSANGSGLPRDPWLAFAWVRDAIPPATTSIVAELSESLPSIVDSALTAAGGRVIRRDAAQVAAEIQ